MKSGKKLLLVFVLVSGVISPVMAFGDSLTPIQLTARQEIADIEELDAAVGNLTDKMRQCAAAGLAPLPKCHCQYPQKLEVTRTALHRILNKYPQWQNRAVLWWNTDGTMPSNLHLGGIDTRISQPCGTTELSIRQPEPRGLSSRVFSYN